MVEKVIILWVLMVLMVVLLVHNFRVIREIDLIIAVWFPLIQFVYYGLITTIRTVISTYKLFRRNTEFG